MVPNLFAMCLILATLQLGLAILTESSLSFLGVGVPPDVPTWGGMLREAARAFVGVAPWLAIFPGLTIALAVFGVNLLGDALRDVLDPRLRSDGGAGQSRADN
jgi:peptide/nickel transport system permease protein